MEYRTENFKCPEGGIMIYAIYKNKERELTFEIADGFCYPQDGRNMIMGAKTYQFIYKNSKTLCSLKEANEYLSTLGIEERFNNSIEHK